MLFSIMISKSFANFDLFHRFSSTFKCLNYTNVLALHAAFSQKAFLTLGFNRIFVRLEEKFNALFPSNI